MSWSPRAMRSRCGAAVELEPTPRRRGGAAGADPLRPRRDRRGARACSDGARQLRRRRACRADRARARGRHRTPDLSEAFAALDAGDQERALDLLIDALPSADGAQGRHPPRRRRACSTSSGSSTRSPARRAAGSPPRSTRAPAQTAQRQLLVGGVAGRLEPGHPDAEQPHRPRRREPAQQLERDRADAVGACSTGSASVRARVWVEKSSSRTLIPIVRPRRCWATERRAQPLDEAVEDRLQLAERRRCRDRTSSRATRRSPCAPGSPATSSSNRARRCSSAPSRGAEPLPPARARAPRRARRASSSPRPRRRSAVLGPIPGTSPHGAPANRSQACSRGEHDEAARLLGVGGDLGHELVGPDPDRAAEPGRALDLGAEPPHRRVRRGQPGELEVGLVEPDHLDRLDVRADDRHHLARGLAVVGEVGRQEHAVGAQPARPRRPASPSRRRTGGPRRRRW